MLQSFVLFLAVSMISCTEWMNIWVKSGFNKDFTLCTRCRWAGTYTIHLPMAVVEPLTWNLKVRIMAQLWMFFLPKLPINCWVHFCSLTENVCFLDWKIWQAYASIKARKVNSLWRYCSVVPKDTNGVRDWRNANFTWYERNTWSDFITNWDQNQNII